MLAAKLAREQLILLIYGGDWHSLDAHEDEGGRGVRPPPNMNGQHPNYLVFLKTRVQEGLFDYEPLRAWLAGRHRQDVASVGSTAHALLLYSREPKSQIESAIRNRVATLDDLRVIRVRDFEWPSALPDDETLQQWLGARSDWREWSAGH